MASEESFIKEVTEEVRRERLFGYLRRYGWIGIVAVLVLVGGAAWNEIRKANARAEAEAMGDAVLAALDIDSPTARAVAVSGIPAEGDLAAVMALLAAGQSSEDAALERLDTLASDPALSPTYRDLAAIKGLLLRGADVPPADRIARLEPMTAPGAPYRPIALELTAYAHVEAGDDDTALAILTDLLADGEATQGLRQRASQLIVALGGSLDAS